MKKFNRISLLIHWVLIDVLTVGSLMVANKSNLVKETPDAMLFIFPAILLGNLVYRSLIFIWRLNDAGKSTQWWIIFVLLNPIDVITLIILMSLPSKENEKK